MIYFVIDFLSRTIFSLLNLLPCSPASGKNRNLVYVLQKDHRSLWRSRGAPQPLLVEAHEWTWTDTYQLRCHREAEMHHASILSNLLVKSPQLVNMMLPLLTFPTPVNIVWYRLTSQGPSSANRSPFCCFDLAALFLTKCFQFRTFGNYLKHLNLRFTETFHRRKYSYVGGFVALLFPPGRKHGLLSVSRVYLLTKMQPRQSGSLLPDERHKSRCFLSSVCAHGHFSAAIFLLSLTPSMTRWQSAHTDPCTFFSPSFHALVYYNEETSFVKGKGCYKKGCYESKVGWGRKFYDRERVKK